jgi:hypothetical protein
VAEVSDVDELAALGVPLGRAVEDDDQDGPPGIASPLGGLLCVVADVGDDEEEVQGVAEKAQQPARRDDGRMQFTHRTDGSDELHERGNKGFDWRPPTPEPQPIAPSTAAASTADSGSSGQGGSGSQPSVGQQDGGPVNYNG